MTRISSGPWPCGSAVRVVRTNAGPSPRSTPGPSTGSSGPGDGTSARHLRTSSRTAGCRGVSGLLVRRAGRLTLAPEVIRLDLPVQRRPLDAQDLGRPALVPVGVL